MRFFYDTEFIEDGETIELISIGIVGDDGREYYAVSTDFDPARAGEWVRNNVLNQLPNPNSSEWKSLDTIRTDLEKFLHVPGGAELWAWAATTMLCWHSCGEICLRCLDTFRVLPVS